MAVCQFIPSVCLCVFLCVCVCGGGYLSGLDYVKESDFMT